MSAPHQIVESDADYFASMQPGDMDPEYTGLIASATLKRIVRTAPASTGSNERKWHP